MASVSLFVFFFIAHLVSLHSAEDEGIYPPNCPPFVCGKLGKIGFPFANHTSPECGLCILNDWRDPTNKTTPKIQLERNGTKLYDVEGISQADTIQIKDQQLQSERERVLKRMARTVETILTLKVFICDLTITVFRCQYVFFPRLLLHSQRQLLKSMSCTNNVWDGYPTQGRLWGLGCLSPSRFWLPTYYQIFKKK